MTCTECNDLGPCDSCAPPKYKIIRVTEKAHHRLRELYVDTGETLTDIASRLIIEGAEMSAACQETSEDS